MVIQPLPGTATFNKANPSPSEALEQNQRAKREIAKSSQDNLKACTDLLVRQDDMVVPPPFKPPGKKEGEGAIPKSSSMVARNETSMETDATTAAVPRRPPVTPPCPPQQSDSNKPTLVKQECVNGPTTCCRVIRVDGLPHLNSGVILLFYSLREP